MLRLRPQYQDDATTIADHPRMSPRHRIKQNLGPVDSSHHPFGYGRHSLHHTGLRQMGSFPKAIVPADGSVRLTVSATVPGSRQHRSCHQTKCHPSGELSPECWFHPPSRCNPKGYWQDIRTLEMSKLRSPDVSSSLGHAQTCFEFYGIRSSDTPKRKERHFCRSFQNLSSDYSAGGSRGITSSALPGAPLHLSLAVYCSDLCFPEAGKRPEHMNLLRAQSERFRGNQGRIPYLPQTTKPVNGYFSDD